MSCRSCQSGKQQSFPSEINVHFPGRENLSKPTVMAFPKILICLNCGFAEFQVPTAELQRLAEGFAETSNGTKRRSTKRQKSA